MISKWESGSGEELDTKQVFSDYREVDGLTFPFRRTFYIKGGKFKFKDYKLLTDFKIKELKIVDTLPNNTFALP